MSLTCDKYENTDCNKIEPNLDNPLVTIVLLTYNQEKYVQEAIEGVFSQTYSPLEIIISDDCSTDTTFDSILNNYKNYSGEHTVIINRNEKNMGIGGHVQKVAEMAKGELIVAAAGDDISLPNRVTELTKMWLLLKKPISVICSPLILIDKKGVFHHVENRSCPPFSFKEYFLKGGLFWGASAAWDRRLFSNFSAIRSDVIHEDVILTFRALLMDGIFVVDEALVKYRFDTGISVVPKKENKSGEWMKEYQIIAAKHICIYTDQNKIDLECIKTTDENKKLKNDILNMINNRYLKGKLILSVLVDSTWIEAIKILFIVPNHFFLFIKLLCMRYIFNIYCLARDARQYVIDCLRC